jgi:hypothetical protein
MQGAEIQFWPVFVKRETSWLGRAELKYKSSVYHLSRSSLIGFSGLHSQQELSTQWKGESALLVLSAHDLRRKGKVLSPNPH